MNLYEVLEIEQTDDLNEIKRAYFNLRRQFDSSLEAKEFQQIRKAYETLMNPKMKLEYDTMSEHGEEINRLMNEGKDALENGHYTQAIQCFKKVIVIQPKLTTARHHYAATLAAMKEYDKAIKQYHILMTGESNNIIYLCEIGQILFDMQRYNEAIEQLEKAEQLDLDNVEITFALSQMYYDIERKTKAKQVLKRAIERRLSSGFVTFVYFFRLLELEMMDRNEKEIENVLQQIEQLVERYPEEKLYVASRYGQFAAMLFDYKLFKLAKSLTERAISYDPDHEFISRLHEKTEENQPVYDEFERLEKDEAVSEWVRKLFYLYLFGDEYSEEEFKEYNDKAYDNLFMAACYEPEFTMRSIKRVNIKYPSLYEQRAEVLEKYLEVCKRYEGTEALFNQLKEDSSVIQPLKRLVALELSQNLSPSERQEHFDESCSDLEDYADHVVVASIQSLKMNYAKLYQLNQPLFDKIYSVVNESVKKNSTHNSTHSNNGSSRSNSNNNYSSTSHTSHARSSTSSTSSSSACFVATAAYGSPLVEELDTLRAWRDQILSQNWFGKRFIKFYYRYGPYAATVIEKSPRLKRAVQYIVYRIVNRLSKSYHFN